jgi:Holliday junction resolvasome RuvABC endonuclease subunit
MQKKQRVLALDLSTKTGWAVLDLDPEQSQTTLVAYGVERVPTETWKAEFPYPLWCLRLAQQQAQNIRRLYLEYLPTLVAIEHVEKKGHDSAAQLTLNFIHYAVLETLTFEGVSPKYILPHGWRIALDQRLTKEQRASNAVLSRAKRNGRVKEVKAKTGIRGKVTKKHVTVRWVNETFGLDLKISENDISDAISIGCAALVGGCFYDGTRPPRKGKTK